MQINEQANALLYLTPGDNMKKSATDIITIEQLKALREAGFVVVHRVPTESMIKAGLSTAKWPENRGVEKEFHRMVAESIRMQKSEDPAP